MLQLVPEIDSLFRNAIPTVPDFPIPGIAFKDISPLLAEPNLLAIAVDHLLPAVTALNVDAILAIESRGFILGAPLAAQLRCGLVLVRKPGKLPGSRDRYSYTCEYSSGHLEVNEGAIVPSRKYVIVDDVLATGGTARATADYLKSRKGIIAGYAFLLELTFLGGRQRLTEGSVLSLLRY